MAMEMMMRHSISEETAPQKERQTKNDTTQNIYCYYSSLLLMLSCCHVVMLLFDNYCNE